MNTETHAHVCVLSSNVNATKNIMIQFCHVSISYLAHFHYRKASNEKSWCRSQNMFMFFERSIYGDRYVWSNAFRLGYWVHQMLRWVREKQAIWVASFQIQPWLDVPSVKAHKRCLRMNQLLKGSYQMNMIKIEYPIYSGSTLQSNEIILFPPGASRLSP